MDTVIVGPTTTAIWHSLVIEAEKSFGRQLCVEMESYLVFLLERFTTRPELASSILAIEYLNSSEMGKSRREETLRDVGDKCLLFSGLFPERAFKLLVPVSYFVDLGKQAYTTLAHAHGLHAAQAKLYEALYQHFVSMMDILHCIRELDGKFKLSLIQAEELWQEAGSVHALNVLHDASKNPIIAKGKNGGSLH